MTFRAIKKIILHVTDSPDTLDVGAKEVREWHTMKPPKGRGWDDIGYHYVVRRNGVVEQGRPEAEIGAHTLNHNSDSIGVVWVGDKLITPAQRKSLITITQALMAKYGLKGSDVYGHYEFDKGKTCPNLDMRAIRAELLPVQGPKQ